MSKDFLPADYVPVADRIAKFRIDHPYGTIATEIVFDDGDRVVFRATVKLSEVVATGHAEELRSGHGMVNKQGFGLENAETGAVGRALHNAGYLSASGVSVEEHARSSRMPAQPFWRIAGYADEESYRTTVSALVERAGLLAPPQREALKVYRQSAEIPWPPRSGDLDALNGWIDNALGADLEAPASDA